MPTLINSATPQTIKVGITFCLSGRLRRTKKPSKKVCVTHTHRPTLSVIQKTPIINNSQRAPLRNSYVLFTEAGSAVAEGVEVGGGGGEEAAGMKKAPSRKRQRYGGLFEFAAKQDYQICDGGNHCQDDAVLKK